MPPAFTILRYVVFGAVALAALVAFSAMAVQRRMINPFGRLARAVRGVSDPLIKPIERRMLRTGGNPQQAPWWLIGIALVAGILLMTVAQWGLARSAALRHASSSGGSSVAYVLLDWTFSLLGLALLVRVIGSWMGAGQYNKWMRPFYFMTEWLLAPLRRLLPPFGALDLSPLVAWLLIQLVRPAVLGLL